VASAWNLAWPGSPSGAFAMVCAAAMIGAAMQAPLSGLALVLELTHSGFGLMVPLMAATGIATLVAFHVDGYSIYSARLPAFADDSAPAASADGRAQQTSRGDPGRVLAAGSAPRPADGLLSSGCAAALAIPPDMVVATWLGLLGVGLGSYIPANNTAIMTAIPPGRRALPAGW
jgi:Voltage gated chloride channel